MTNKKFYLTTTLPYVNAEPHIGFALEMVQADIVARYRALTGDEVFFNTGTDEHGLKIHRKALESGVGPQQYVDEYAAKFRDLTKTLDLYPGLHFIRTTDPHHKSAAQEFWKRCDASGDIYKKDYTISYCVGCELEKTASELVDGKCQLHPNLDIEHIHEENYFFRWSKYQKPLLEMYAARPDFVLPGFRFNEIRKFVENGLEDFSISRLKEKMPWGIEVPGDSAHVMYVWFDALINYVSTLGWPEDAAQVEKFWGTKERPNGVQFAGKDQIRQQAAMWQAMLMSAGLPQTKQILIHGFITSDGQKMSKSLGNVVNPMALVDEYGVDALRYFLARHIHPFEDSDFTMEKFKAAYNADLANGLGNLAARIMQLAATHLVGPSDIYDARMPQEIKNALDNFEINKAADFVWNQIGDLDKYIQAEKPFSVVKDDKERGIYIIKNTVGKLYSIAEMLKPRMPETSRKIKDAIKQNKMPPPLFLRK